MVAVVFEAAAKDYHYRSQAIALKGALHRYDFDIGRAMCAALFRSVNTLYERPVEMARMPQSGEYEYVIVFSLQKGHIDLSFEDNPFKFSARALSTLSVNVELVNGKTMDALHKERVTGRAFLIRALGEASSREAEQVFAAAIDSSVQQLSDNAMSVLDQWTSGRL